VALNIVELFGYAPADRSPAARAAREDLICPFLGSRCTKKLNDGLVSGACTVKSIHAEPVICCPNRLYASSYQILVDMAVTAFGPSVRLIQASEVPRVKHDGRNVAAFGKRWLRELRLPQRGGRGGYFVDWILALIDSSGRLAEFVAVEVQSIDTTGNYRAEREEYLAERSYPGSSPAGLNWENVSKRILPQIIYKGHVLRREPLCKKGLFFVCPGAVYERVRSRLGGSLLEYGLQPGALTFRWYDVGSTVPSGAQRSLEFRGQFTTTVDQVALAFTAPSSLPPERVYEGAIRTALT